MDVGHNEYPNSDYITRILVKTRYPCISIPDYTRSNLRFLGILILYMYFITHKGALLLHLGFFVLLNIMGCNGLLSKMFSIKLRHVGQRLDIRNLVGFI